MTAEERMAYFYGEKRRNQAAPDARPVKNKGMLILKFKFFAAMIIFVLFLSLDYTGYKIKGIGSAEIVREVVKDMEIPSVQFGISL